MMASTSDRPRGWRIWVSLIGVATLAGAVACHRTRVGARLDEVESTLEEWGTATVSALLVTENTGQFKLEYDKPAAFYVDAARTRSQGAAGRLRQQAHDLNIALKGSNLGAGSTEASATTSTTTAGTTTTTAADPKG